MYKCVAINLLYFASYYIELCKLAMIFVCVARFLGRFSHEKFHVLRICMYGVKGLIYIVSQKFQYLRVLVQQNGTPSKWRTHVNLKIISRKLTVQIKMAKS